MPQTESVPSIVGTWRLLEVNSLPMQETPPYGQINRKEVYTADGKLLVAAPDAPFATANEIGQYREHNGVRTYVSPDGEEFQSPINWMGDDHFFFEFSPGERWFYVRVKGANANEQEWEPRSVVVVRMTADGSGPTLRDFAYDETDDSAMPWDKRVFGAWETIKVAGSGVSGPDTPPYGMPNDRFLISSAGTMQKVHANGEADRDGDVVNVAITGNKITIIEAQFDLYFWFNKWGQLVLEQEGMQTVMKRVSFDAHAAPPGPIVVVLLTSEREEPPHDGKIVEVRKSSIPAAPTGSAPHAGNAATRGSSAYAPSAPKPTFKQPYHGGSDARALSLDGSPDSFAADDSANKKAVADGLGALIPVIDTDYTDQFVTARASSIGATIEIPFGWHAVDDSIRTLVFDADHFVEIALAKYAGTSDVKTHLQSMLDQQRAKQPDLKAQLNENPDGSVFLMMQNLHDGNATRARAYVSRATDDGGSVIAQVSAAAQDIIRALNLSEVLFRNLKPINK